MKQKYDNLIKGIRNYFSQSGIESGVLGLSGGIDSALTLRLSVDALGKDNVTALIMPDSSFSSDENQVDAVSYAKELGVKYYKINISEYIETFNLLPWGRNDAADMNIRARIRMCILYHFANKNGSIVLGTGNKTEMKLGYGTKYGDFGVDIEVLGSLYKTEVFEMSRFLNLPKEFINKKPSAELKKNHSDEDEIGFSYEIIDNVLRSIEAGEVIDKQYSSLIERIKMNKHKTSQIPIIN